MGVVSDEHNRGEVKRLVVQLKASLPVVVDPSHAAGHVDWVECLTLSGVAAGGDGLLVETHPDPSVARSDGKQAVVLSDFGGLMEKTRRVAAAVGRTVPAASPLAAVAG